MERLFFCSALDSTNGMTARKKEPKTLADQVGLQDSSRRNTCCSRISRNNIGNWWMATRCVWKYICDSICVKTGMTKMVTFYTFMAHHLKVGRAPRTPYLPLTIYWVRNASSFLHEIPFILTEKRK